MQPFKSPPVYMLSAYELPWLPILMHHLLTRFTRSHNHFLTQRKTNLKLITCLSEPAAANRYFVCTERLFLSLHLHKSMVSCCSARTPPALLSFLNPAAAARPDQSGHPAKYVRSVPSALLVISWPGSLGALGQRWDQRLRS